MPLVYAQLTYLNFIMISIVDFKKKIIFISNWQLKTTFLALWTKIFFYGRICFQILKQYSMGHLYAQAYDSSYQTFFLMTKIQIEGTEIPFYSVSNGHCSAFCSEGTKMCISWSEKQSEMKEGMKILIFNFLFLYPFLEGRYNPVVQVP